MLYDMYAIFALDHDFLELVLEPGFKTACHTHTTPRTLDIKKMLMLQHFPAPPPPRHWLPKELSEGKVVQSFATTTNGNPIASPIVASCAGWRQATFWDAQEFVLRRVA